MNDVAIRAEKLSKKYYIGKRLDKRDTLRDTVAGIFTQ